MATKFASSQKKAQKLRDYFFGHNGKAGRKATQPDSGELFCQWLDKGADTAPLFRNIGGALSDKALNQALSEDRKGEHRLLAVASLGKLDVLSHVLSSKDRIHAVNGSNHGARKNLNATHPQTGNNLLHEIALHAADKSHEPADKTTTDHILASFRNLKRTYPTQFKAMINAKNNRGQTPLDVALEASPAKPEKGHKTHDGVWHAAPENKQWSITDNQQQLVSSLLDLGANQIAATAGLVHLERAAKGTPLATALKQAEKRYDVYDREGNTPLHVAAAGGYAGSIGAIVDTQNNTLGQKYALLNQKNASGLTALHIAARGADHKKASQAIATLIQKGADTTIGWEPNASEHAEPSVRAGDTPAHVAIRAGNAPAFFHLQQNTSFRTLSRTNAAGDTPLHIAAEKGVGFVSILNILVLNPKSQKEKERAERLKHVMSVPNLAGKTPFAIALEKGDFDSLDIMFDAGAEQLFTYDRANNRFTYTPAQFNERGQLTHEDATLVVNIPKRLQKAVSQYVDYRIAQNNIIDASKNAGFVEIMSLLESDGRLAYTKQHGTGKTPLHLISENKTLSAKEKLDLASKLVKMGADVNARSNSGYTPLHSAAEFDQGEIAAVLLKAQNIDTAAALPGSNKTALHIAAKTTGSKVLVEITAHPGNLDLNAKDADGYTAFDLAMQDGVEKNSSDNINLLISFKKDDLKPALSNKTDINECLKHALEHKKFRVINALLSLGAEPEKASDIQEKVAHALDAMVEHSENINHDINAEFLSFASRALDTYKGTTKSEEEETAVSKELRKDGGVIDTLKQKANSELAKRDAQGNHLLHKLAASEHSSRKYIAYVTQKDPVLKYKRNNNGETYLHTLAATRDDESFLKTAKEDVSDFWMTPALTETDKAELQLLDDTYPAKFKLLSENMSSDDNPLLILDPKTRWTLKTIDMDAAEFKAFLANDVKIPVEHLQLTEGLALEGTAEECRLAKRDAISQVLSVLEDKEAKLPLINEAGLSKEELTKSGTISKIKDQQYNLKGLSLDKVFLYLDLQDKGITLASAEEALDKRDSAKSLNSFEGSLNTALHVAVEKGRSVGFVKQMLDATGKSDKASQKIAGFIDAPNKAGNSALHIAIEKGNTDLFEVMLQSKILPEMLSNHPKALTEQSLLDEKTRKLISESGNKEAFEKIYKEVVVSKMVSRAALLPDMLINEAIDCINSNEIDIKKPYDDKGKGLIHFAAMSGQVELFQALAEKDNSLLTSRDRDNIDPVYAAFGRCPHPDPSKATALRNYILDLNPPITIPFDQKLDPNSAGDSILHNAVSHASVEVLGKLLKRDDAKEQINRRNFHGKSPLFKAVEMAGSLDPKKVALLLENGANIYQKENEGESPYSRIKSHLDQYDDGQPVPDNIAMANALLSVVPPEEHHRQQQSVTPDFSFLDIQEPTPRRESALEQLSNAKLKFKGTDGGYRDFPQPYLDKLLSQTVFLRLANEILAPKTWDSISSQEKKGLYPAFHEAAQQDANITKEDVHAIIKGKSALTHNKTVYPVRTGSRLALALVQLEEANLVLEDKETGKTTPITSGYRQNILERVARDRMIKDTLSTLNLSWGDLSKSQQQEWIQHFAQDAKKEANITQADVDHIKQDGVNFSRNGKSYRIYSPENQQHHHVQPSSHSQQRDWRHRSQSQQRVGAHDSHVSFERAQKFLSAYFTFATEEYRHAVSQRSGQTFSNDVWACAFLKQTVLESSPTATEENWKEHISPKAVYSTLMRQDVSPKMEKFHESWQSKPVNQLKEATFKNAQKYLLPAQQNNLSM